MTDVIPEQLSDLLERPLLGHLATTRPDGSPQVNPMWFLWDGTHLRFTHTSRRAKFRNVRHEPRVAMSVVDPDHPSRYLEVRGTVESVDDDPTGAFYVALAQRYSRPPNPPADAPDRVVLVVRPESISFQDRR
ncbi:MAG: PPOX class F420-dependent oxidoreductase [Pseudonocardia sp.]|uniref:PPOX class F420-dependent oxidoreductase n=1 Tax=unclassified Pseudonocardia TaxID=2619320 RepID=UPI00086C7E7C|nr:MULTISPECIES: PPOX class F420-dependent oxidoreductase [unclassified Pseudonocardia]MBN9111800.1 PPOX class F420-dependent oxidoreductase [Pseudonocardia sp.]ODU23893.1 MAG: PPOX class F420-dependent enzyme [Pseudonocardia sp. SCN 72-51]ODV06837.1 MAG: PPOX class F420-dependent enzyme [Pseudonocardia sp. SCN 73-27]